MCFSIESCTKTLSVLQNSYLTTHLLFSSFFATVFWNRRADRLFWLKNSSISLYDKSNFREKYKTDTKIRLKLYFYYRLTWPPVILFPKFLPIVHSAPSGFVFLSFPITNQTHSHSRTLVSNVFSTWNDFEQNIHVGVCFFTSFKSLLKWHFSRKAFYNTFS